MRHWRVIRMETVALEAGGFPLTTPLFDSRSPLKYSTLTCLRSGLVYYNKCVWNSTVNGLWLSFFKWSTNVIKALYYFVYYVVLTKTENRIIHFYFLLFGYFWRFIEPISRVVRKLTLTIILITRLLIVHPFIRYYII